MCNIYRGWTVCLRDLHGFLHGIEWIMLTVTWVVFKNHFLEVGLTRKSGDHGILNTHNRWFILFYHGWGPAWIEIHWNSLWLRARHIWLHTTLEALWAGSVSLDVCWDGLWTLSFGLSQVTALGSCVKRPWGPVTIALQVVSMLEKAEPVHVRFKLCLRDQESIKWMQDGCKVFIWIPTWHQMDHVSWSLGLFSKTTSCKYVRA